MVVLKNKIIRICRKILSCIQKADHFFLRKKIYQWLCILFFSVIAVLLLNSYNIIDTHSNYSYQTLSTIRLDKGIPISFSFQADNKNMSSFRLYKDVSHTRLSVSDKATVWITSNDGEQVLSTEVYLYHPSRNYILVNCGNVALNKDEIYTITFKISEFAPGSTFYLSSHELNTFGSITSDTITSDLPIGLSRVPNVTYSYSVLSYSHMIPHQIIFFLFLIGLFFNRIMEKRWVRELYRGAFICSMIYITQEILNVSKSDPMQLLFPLTPHHYFVFLSGMLILILFYYLFYAITGSGTLAIIITGVLGLMAGFANHFKIVMRGDPAMPWDLFSAGIAAKISTKYKFQITQRFVASVIMIFLIVIVVRLIYTPIVRGIKKRILAVMGTTFVLAAFIAGVILNQGLLRSMDVSYSMFPPLQSYNENGTMLALALHMNHLSVEGGENNSPEATEDVVAKYVDQVKNEIPVSPGQTDEITRPNVICIMSESFSDLSEMREIDTSEEVMPFYNSLKNNSIYGDLAVSVFGGGTCNTEFEFLTGYSVKSLLAGSSVYSLYVNHSLDAMPQIYKDEGYRTLAMHPFDATWWGREDAYPLLGFDQFISDIDFVEPELVRGYISDKSAFERLISEYESTDTATPFFSFLITMQNHADYTEYWDNQAYDIRITNFPEKSFPCTEHYFSLLRESDDALKELITYFQSVEEPTIVVIFGDHKPFLDTDLYSTLLGEDLSQITAKQSLSLYTTPYLIWANYDIGEGNKGITSPNLLGQTVLDLSGVQSPDERACLRILQTKISAMSAIAVFDKDQTAYTKEDALPDDIYQIIDDYEFIQYGKLFLEDSDAVPENSLQDS